MFNCSTIEMYLHFFNDKNTIFCITFISLSSKKCFPSSNTRKPPVLVNS